MSNPLPILNVALPVPLRRTFDYLAPEQSPTSGTVGSRVRVKFGNQTLIGIIVSISDTSEYDLNKLREAEKILDETPCITPELLSLCLWGAKYYHHAIGEVLNTALPKRFREGLDIPVPTGYQLTVEGKGLSENALKRAKKQQQLVTYLLQHHQASTQDLKKQGISNSIINALLEKQIIREVPLITAPIPSDKKILNETPLSLTNEQEAALLQVRFHHYCAYVLEGATGSGKTEVFLQTAERCLRADKQVLVLIPEIGLSTQTVNRFRRRFSGTIEVLHSNISDMKRAEAWQAAREGNAQVIIGTRLATMTPFKDLGLIIVDEEHDLSYKQQDGFKYSARDIAIVRAKKNNIPIILGSATPSLETLHNAIQGKYELLRLTKRAGEAKPPKIHLADLRGQQLTGGLSTQTLEAIQKHLNSSNQALVFLNRRGYAPSLLCHQCGWTAGCRSCDTRLTLHQHPFHLHCHHCDFQCRVPHTCPSCHSPSLVHSGLGTEQLEEALKGVFPHIPVYRVDRDTTQTVKGFSEILEKVNEGKPCILVGTQMLAKGHHFSKLTLVVIADADQGLFSADFRSTERLAQQIVQVAGRAGRENEQGEVIIQSHCPEHPTFKELLTKGYHRFARTLIEERSLNHLPPKWNLTTIKAESKRAENAIELLEFIRTRAMTIAPPSQNLNYLGPIPAAVEKINDRFRYYLQIKTLGHETKSRLLTELLKEIDQNALAKRTRWSIDVDSVE